MSQQAESRSKPPQVWGKRSAAFYNELQNKAVLVAVSGGKIFKGRLIGVDVYDIIIAQESGLELLLPKGNIVYIHQVGEGS
ncbi:MAG: LSm family protein [Anaerolineae bacterium]